MTSSIDIVEQHLDLWRATSQAPFILGLCGSQGIGKSTLSAELADRLMARGLNAQILSLDDLYLSRACRAAIARAVHPLFATRGVPGTHDVELGALLLDAVKAGREVILPRFDKAMDDPMAVAHWRQVKGRIDVLIFEGWCVGARAQDREALDTPVNALEADQDPDGVWRRRANEALAQGYADLFDRIDRLVLLAAPGFEIVERWRCEQERDLRRRLDREGRAHLPVMSDEAVGAFIQHYERLTRHILNDMPDHADLVLRLDETRALKDRS